MGDGEAHFRALLLEGRNDPDSVAKHSRGSGVMVSFQSGSGQVFTAGTCEWVAGLAGGDFYTDQITRNVLDRVLTRRSADS